MHVLPTFHAMARNYAWSNPRLHRACAELSADELTAKRTSFFPSIHETLTDVLYIDWCSLDALERGGRGRGIFRRSGPVHRLQRAP
jgi:uncharacterized damage-inducible protein DinB